MKKRLLKEDDQLAKMLLESNPGKSFEEVVPAIQIDFGVWDKLDDVAKEAVLGCTARFCENVFRAFIMDAANARKGIDLRWGQGAIESCLDMFDRKIREGASLGQG